MDKLLIKGGRPLSGTITVSGSKNASLPILFACILMDGRVELTNVPRLKDIDTSLKLLEILGCRTGFDNGRVEIDCCGISSHEAPYDLVRTMRASVLCLGPLLAKLGRAKVALPGGCAIGARPVDMHLTALEKMGAVFKLESGYIEGRCDGGLKGAHIQFDFPTVGGTENLLMAAALADGESILENAAKEPEVVDLAEFLIACGADIRGHGTSIVKVRGVSGLSGRPYRVMSDRIEAGTYLTVAPITRGRITLENFPLDALDAVMNKYAEMGVSVVPKGGGIVEVENGRELECVDVVTQPYPGFPTDMQAQIMALMTVSKGSGMVTETIFENRFMHVLELVRMGARIKLKGQNAVVRGVDHLVGAPVMASDLRASASLVLAGLAAHGITEVQRIYHLDRGYERIEEKLAAVGADIKRVKD